MTSITDCANESGSAGPTTDFVLRLRDLQCAPIRVATLLVDLPIGYTEDGICNSPQSKCRKVVQTVSAYTPPQMLVSG